MLTSNHPGLTCARPGLRALTCGLWPTNPCPLCSLQVKANKNSPHLSRLQECSRTVNERAANVVASTKSGQEQIEDRDTMDFSGLSLIKLKKQEMETQVRVLELEKTLEAERVRLGELRKQHYVLAGGMGTPGEEEPSRPSPAPRSGTTKKPPLAQKPSIAPRPDNQVPGIGAGLGRSLPAAEWGLHSLSGIYASISSTEPLIFDPCSSTRRMVSTQLNL